MVFFDPVKITNELLVTVAVVIALIFIFKYRERVLLALTGDDKLHGSCLDCIWFGLCQCCGLCTGEWTRCLTAFACCPQRLRRKNLKRALAQCLGLSSHSVELKNIVVGDLPFDGRGDFYLCVECASNPTMVTSLAEDKLPKVVHFPEILTLKIRNSPLEESVRITVKELHVFGSQELCVVNLSPMQILHWMSAGENDQGERMKRFEMKPVSAEIQRESPAWILVEFDEPQEARDIDSLRGSTHIRTATRNTAERYEEVDIKDYKDTKPLLDTTGHAIDEPLEEDLEGIRTMRIRAIWCFHFWNCWTVLLILVYGFFRLYVWSCYRRFNWLTMARLNGVEHPEDGAPFPLSFKDMEEIGDQCAAKTDGTGAAFKGQPCSPTRKQVDQICINKQDEVWSKYGQPWPKAFGGYQWLEDLTGNSQTGIECYVGVCDVRHVLRDNDVKIALLCAALLLSNLGIRMCCNSWIRRTRAKKIKDRQAETQRFRAMTRTQQPGSFFG